MESPFASVHIYDATEFAILLTVRKANSRACYLFVIHKITGTIDFNNIEGISVFTETNSLYSYLDTYYPQRKEIGEGIGLIGINRFCSKLCIIVVQEAVEVGYFANKHSIYKITKTQNYWFDLPYYQDETRDDSDYVEKINNFTINECHIFCNTKDLTIPIGYKNTKRDFVWNTTFSKIFDKLGAEDACIKLLQGCASTKIVKLSCNLIRLTIITLRAAEHGGTRYKARGLNKDGYPANEVQCEIIFESSNGIINSHVWRRGTVPVEWRTDVNISSHLTVEENSTVRSPLYFNRLKKEFSTKGFEGFVIMNLLHNNEKHAERKLCDAYEDAVRKLDYVKYISFDWHAIQSSVGLPKAVEKYLAELFDKMGSPSFTVLMPVNEVETNNTPTGTMRFANDSILKMQEYDVHEHQKAIIRVNCADSLDRTNVGCFWFTCLLVLTYTAWMKQPIKYNDLLSIEPEVKRFLSEAFIQTGNTVSFMYTDTEACMTKIFRDFGDISEKAANDKMIAIMRRKANMFSDTEKDKGIRLFSGLEISDIINSYDFGINLTCISSYPSRFLKHLTGSVEDETELLKLTMCSPATIQMQSTAATYEITMMLSKPVYINAIVLQSTPHNSPIFLSLKGGLTLDSMVPLSEKFAIPVCQTSSQMIYKIPPDICNGVHPLTKVVSFIFTSGRVFTTLSNIFVYGSYKPIPTNKETYSETFIDLDYIRKDKHWPKISDTSSIYDIVSMNREPSLEGAIEIELSRLHHKSTRLATMATMFMQGLNPHDFVLTNFACKQNNEIGRHVCSSSLAGESTWKCYSCGMNFCPRCSKRNIMNPSILFDEKCCLCNKCFAIYNEKEERIKNLFRFYSQYYRLHYSGQNEWKAWESTIRDKSTDCFTFPQAAVIYATDNLERTLKPTANLLLTPMGTSLSGGDILQVVIGVTCTITKITFDASDDIELEIHAQKQYDKDVFTVDGSHKVINTSISCNTFDIYIISGTLRRVKFEGTPDNVVIPHQDIIDEEKYSNLPSPITKRLSISNTDPYVLFEFRNKTNIYGIILEKFAGATGAVAIFTEKENDEATESEFFYLPMGVQNYSIKFEKEHYASLVKVYFTDKTPMLQSAKISLF